jgi:AraC family transcriptional regulator of arabinose operon
MQRSCGSPDYTLLFVKTEAFFESGGIYTETPPNTVILYDKNCYVHYGCRQPHYNDDWLHFDLDAEDLPFLLGLGIPFNTPMTLPAIGQISEYIRLAVLEKHSNNLYCEQIIDGLMRSLLYSISSQIHTVPDARLSNKYYAPMHQLRLEIFNAPHKKWGVEQMAQSVYISPSYFQHLYKELFGISCIQDIIRARLKNACFYLCTTEMSIHALADFCGYENELHFMRQFKKQLGMTPSQYREQHRHSSP